MLLSVQEVSSITHWDCECWRASLQPYVRHLASRIRAALTKQFLVKTYGDRLRFTLRRLVWRQQFEKQNAPFAKLPRPPRACSAPKTVQPRSVNELLTPWPRRLPDRVAHSASSRRRVGRKRPKRIGTKRSPLPVSSSNRRISSRRGALQREKLQKHTCARCRGYRFAYCNRRCQGGIS